MMDRTAWPEMATTPHDEVEEPGFFDWWLDELAQMVGGDRHRSLRDPIIALWQQGTIHIVSTKGRKRRRLGSVRIDPYDPTRLIDLDGENVLGRLSQVRRPIVLRLDHFYGLIARDVLPAAASGELRSVIAHRLDVLTPWSAESAYFDFRIVGRRQDMGERQIEIEVGVAPASALDPLLDAFAEAGIEIAAVDVQQTDQWGAPTLDLLRDHRSARLPRWFQLTAAAAGIGIIATSTVLGYEVYLNHQSLAEQRRFAAAIESRVEEIDRIRTEIDNFRTEAALIDNVREEVPSTLNLIEVLSATLPDEVWLEGLELAGRELAIDGYAQSAAQLVPLLETADGLAEVQFQSPSTRAVMTTPDGSSFEAEQFRLGALVSPDLVPTP